MNENVVAPNNTSPSPAPSQKKKVASVVVFVGFIIATGLIAGGVYFFSNRAKVQKPIVTSAANTEAQQKWLYFPGFDDIRDIVFTSDSLWVASIGGLHKYSREGHIIKTYTSADGLPTVPTAVIQIKDKIYVGTQGGVAVLDPATGVFSYLYDKANPAFNGNINHFEYDGKKLWMTTFGGLRSFDIAASEWKSYGHRDSDFALSGTVLHLVERSNPTPVIWALNTVNDQWTQEFQLPSYEWMYIDGNDQYVVATADPQWSTTSNKKNSVLYFRTTAGGAWSEIKLPVSGEGIRYRKLALSGDNKAYFLYQIGNENLLGAYDLVKKEFHQYALGAAGNVGGAAGSVYPDPFQRKIWFTSSPFGYLDLDTNTVQSVFPLQKQKQFYKVLATQDDKLLVNTGEGLGIFNYKTDAFEKISEQQAVSAVWNGNTIWLDLSDVSEMGGGKARLGEYDTTTKNLSVKDMAKGFSLVLGQKLGVSGHVFLTLHVYDHNKATNQIGLFDFENTTFASMLDLDASLLSTSFTSQPFYTEKYGILINKKDGLWSLNPSSNEFRLLFNTPAMPVFTRQVEDSIVVLLDNGSLQKWSAENPVLTLIAQMPASISRKPHSFEVYKNEIAIEFIEPASEYTPGADYGFGPGGFSFFFNKLALINLQGVFTKKLDTRDGMMQVDFSDPVSGGVCLWFTQWGMWAYCE